MWRRVGESVGGPIILNIKDFKEEEPIIHSHIVDFLDEDDYLVDKAVLCDCCKEMLSCWPDGECMRTWIEFKQFNRHFCIKCFSDEKFNGIDVDSLLDWGWITK